MSESPFVVKNVVRPMSVWQFDEAEVRKLPVNGNPDRAGLSLPKEVEDVFEGAGFVVSIIDANKWDMDTDGKFVHLGNVLEATIMERNRTSNCVTVTPGQHVGVLHDGVLTVIEPENVLP